MPTASEAYAPATPVVVLTTVRVLPEQVAVPVHEY